MYGNVVWMYGLHAYKHTHVQCSLSVSCAPYLTSAHVRHIQTYRVAQALLCTYVCYTRKNYAPRRAYVHGNTHIHTHTCRLQSICRLKVLSAHMHAWRHLIRAKRRSNHIQWRFVRNKVHVWKNVATIAAWRLQQAYTCIRRARWRRGMRALADNAVIGRCACLCLPVCLCVYVSMSGLWCDRTPVDTGGDSARI